MNQSLLVRVARDPEALRRCEDLLAVQLGHRDGGKHIPEALLTHYRSSAIFMQTVRTIARRVCVERGWLPGRKPARLGVSNGR